MGIVDCPSIDSIMEKEADMNRRYDELKTELHNLMLIEDFQKTDEQRTREKQLLDELVKIVDKRNELVQHLDNQEKAM
ncbi:DUF3585 [Dermatophagoides pteronyssinus]|uniref:DUF3585 n=1 Tax=Dermatophagoides pteronyssinus TaxID=6956 RepID=A0ABQ8JH22_DERPT|nr:DUF3585 [Dermatophagoides pteronyssinus]